MTTPRRCLSKDAAGRPCRRGIAPSVKDEIHAHCPEHERRLLRESFGPVAWHERAAVHDLPVLVVGGVAA